MSEQTGDPAPAGGLGRWFQSLVRTATGAAHAARPPAHAKAAPARPVVIGLLPSDQDAEIALNNLDEAGFPPHNVSLATSDPARTAALSNTPGAWGKLSPRQVADRLQALGMPEEESAAYCDALLAGQVLIAVRAAADTAAAAGESLGDQKAVRVRTIQEPEVAL